MQWRATPAPPRGFLSQLPKLARDFQIRFSRIWTPGAPNCLSLQRAERSSITRIVLFILHSVAFRISFHYPTAERLYYNIILFLWFQGERSVTRINRCYQLPSVQTKKAELHVFCDSSKRAYGAVAYWRFCLPNGTYHIAFVCSKNRVPDP